MCKRILHAAWVQLFKTNKDQFEICFWCKSGRHRTGINKLGSEVWLKHVYVGTCVNKEYNDAILNRGRIKNNNIGNNIGNMRSSAGVSCSRCYSPSWRAGVLVWTCASTTCATSGGRTCAASVRPDGEAFSRRAVSVLLQTRHNTKCFSTKCFPQCARQAADWSLVPMGASITFIGGLSPHLQRIF